jgi:hypothetical protein
MRFVVVFLLLLCSCILYLTGIATEKWTTAETSDHLDFINMGLFKSKGRVGYVTLAGATCRDDSSSLCQFIFASIFFACAAVFFSFLCLPILLLKGHFACAGFSAMAGGSGLMCWGLWFSAVGCSAHSSYLLQQTGLKFDFSVGYSQIAFLVGGVVHMVLALVMGITWMELPGGAMDEIKYSMSMTRVSIWRACTRLCGCLSPRSPLTSGVRTGRRTGERAPLLGRASHSSYSVQDAE